MCAVVLALFVAPAARQRRAAEFVETLGGIAEYSSPQASRWLRRLIGKDYFQTVEWVYLSRTQIGDAGLVHLEVLTGLEGVNLSGTQVSDAGLAHLRGLTAAVVRHLKIAVPSSPPRSASTIPRSGTTARPASSGWAATRQNALVHD